jgi:hypothetical protein
MSFGMMDIPVVVAAAGSAFLGFGPDEDGRRNVPASERRTVSLA